MNALFTAFRASFVVRAAGDALEDVFKGENCHDVKDRRHAATAAVRYLTRLLKPPSAPSEPGLQSHDR